MSPALAVKVPACAPALPEHIRSFNVRISGRSEAANPEGGCDDEKFNDENDGCGGCSGGGRRRFGSAPRLYLSNPRIAARRIALRSESGRGLRCGKRQSPRRPVARQGYFPAGTRRRSSSRKFRRKTASAGAALFALAGGSRIAATLLPSGAMSYSTTA